MKVVQPKYEILEIPHPSEHDKVLKFIEKIGRTCYKSEDQITDESAPKFIKMLKERHHWAMLEHYIFIIKVPVPVISAIESSITFMLRHQPDHPVKYDIYEKMNYFRYSIHTKMGEHGPERECEYGIISTSATAINYLMQACEFNFYAVPVFFAIGYFLKEHYPELIQLSWTSEPNAKAWYEGFTSHQPFEFMTNEDLVALQSEGDYKSLSLHGWQTVLFTTDRGCCYDDKTKVLTTHGWKYFKDINSNDRLYSLDDNNNIVYVKYNKIIDEKYNGPMHHWHSTEIDLCVTPNHNLWVYDYDKRSSDTRIWKFLTSDEAVNGRYKFNKSANHIPNDRMDVHIPDVKLRNNHRYNGLSVSNDEFFELLGYWITDGSISYGTNGSGNRLVITQTKEFHRNRIETLLNTLSIPYTKYDVEFRLNSPALFHFIAKTFTRENDTHKSTYVRIPRFMMMNMSQSQRMSLLNGIIGGNGTKITNGKGYCVYTASLGLAEDLVELCLRSGLTGSIHKCPIRDRVFPNLGYTSKCLVQAYYVTITDTNNVHIFCNNRNESTSKDVIKYKGHIYCVELPEHHRLYVMRDGKACWCGNSHEVVRHRPASYAQSSTRYCNYSRGQYGSEITVIDPCFFDHGSEQYNTWYNACLAAEHSYMELIDSGATAQMARSVLPNSLMTEVNMTTRLGEWHHFFDMRADKPAHPQMKELAVPLLKDFLDMYYDQYKDLEHRLEENSEYLNVDGGSEDDAE